MTTSGNRIEHVVQGCCTREEFIKEKLKDFVRPDITPAELVQHYDDWSESYGKHLELSTYLPPKIAAQEVTSLFGNNHDIRILDCGAGIGIIAMAVKEANYINIDGLDPSEGMLGRAAENNVYRNYFYEFLGPNRLPIDDNTYDCVLLVNCLIPGHVNGNCFKELSRVTKPGGYILMQTRERYLIEDPLLQQLEPQIDGLCAQGRWQRVKRQLFDNYYLTDRGILIVCKVL